MISKGLKDEINFLLDSPRPKTNKDAVDKLVEAYNLLEEVLTEEAKE